jgi:membrane-associated phospholipid phosphatase
VNIRTRTVPDMPQMLSRRHWTTLLLCLPLLVAEAGAQPADTTKISTDPLFTRRDAYLAVGFLALTAAATPLDERLAQRLQRSGAQNSKFLENASTGVEYIAAPGAYLIGGTLYTVGRLTGNEKMADLGWHGTEAVLVGTGVFVLGKGLFGRARPETVDAKDPRSFRLGRGFRGGPYASFPSGHSTTAFAAAAAVTAETSRWWPRSTWIIAPAMYGGATMVGLSRMYHNKHWASDVAMGALLGTFSGLKVVRYHHSHPDNRLDRWILGSTSMTVAPTGDVAVVVAVPVSLPAR